MKIKVLSDLHLEWGDLGYIYKNHGEDLVILAGDIYTKRNHYKLLRQIPKSVKIVMITGNHEFYQGNFDNTLKYLRDLESEFENFNFLHNSSVKIEDVNFYGGMMCTDFNLWKNQPLAEIHAQQGINDFNLISVYDNDYTGKIRKWLVSDHKVQCEVFKYGLKGWLNRTEGEKRVVISHFIPTEKAINAQYKGSNLNPYFATNAEHWMGWKGYWVFGHTHDSYRGRIGDTELICNPRGAGNYINEEFDEKLIFEI